MKRHPFFAVALTLAVGPVVVVACGGGEPEPKTPAPESSASTMPTPPPPPPASTPVATAEPPPPPPPAAIVEDLPASPDPQPLPTIKIVAPANGLSVGDVAKAKEYQIRLDGKNWNLAKGASHFHLILDEHPYKPIYDTKTPVKLTELLPPNTDLTEGEHLLTAFPSRATHESVKGKGAASFVTFWVGKKGKPTIDPKKKMLIYSRPKGDNFGAMGKEVIIDFYLFNTTLTDGDGDKAVFSVKGPGLATPLTGEFTKWAPKVVRNLQAGDFEVKVELQDKSGKAIDSPYAGATRKIKVDPSAPMDPNMGMEISRGSGQAVPWPEGVPNAVPAAPAAPAAKKAPATGASGAPAAKKPAAPAASAKK